MKKLTILTCALIALSSFMATTVRAQNPHFVGKVTATLTGNNVQVCFKEAGLGNDVLITYTASAQATATYVCVNNGGQCPNAANKTTVSGPVSATGTFSSGQNGSISQCLTFSPPSAGSFSCPSGQNLTLSHVSYTDITITDTTNSVTKAATPSALAVTPFTCP
jgi:hypothetical protein